MLWSHWTYYPISERQPFRYPVGTAIKMILDTFIDVHRDKLNTIFGLKWRRAPAYTAVRFGRFAIKISGLQNRCREISELLNLAGEQTRFSRFAGDRGIRQDQSVYQLG